MTFQVSSPLYHIYANKGQEVQHCYWREEKHWSGKEPGHVTTLILGHLCHSHLHHREKKAIGRSFELQCLEHSHRSDQARYSSFKNRMVYEAIPLWLIKYRVPIWHGKHIERERQKKKSIPIEGGTSRKNNRNTDIKKKVGICRSEELTFSYLQSD